MSKHNACAVCSKEIELKEKLNQVEIFCRRGRQLSLTVCQKHYVEFFLNGQYRFLENYSPSILEWISKNGQPQHVGIVQELLSDYKKLKNRVMLSDND